MVVPRHGVTPSAPFHASPRPQGHGWLQAIGLHTLPGRFQAKLKGPGRFQAKGVQAIGLHTLPGRDMVTRVSSIPPPGTLPGTHSVDALRAAIKRHYEQNTLK